MRKLSGLKPQDIYILLKIVSMDGKPWRTTDLASELSISQSEVSSALFRARYARLVDDNKRLVFRESLLELLVHGVKYVFPQQPGAVVRGIPTAHSAPPLSKMIRSTQTIYVWRDDEGTTRGEEIEPLYSSVPRSIKRDPALYELLALVDVMRVGKPRERELAAKELGRRILRK